eukprot:TRINITY_DN4669_c0_g2_i1.p1 TRINITY_DN4669_c0_g2~~TRINITY_DN4669_c0_g2_i1.p1  ORF type:complete len:274 (-),score=57.13 TRINITY_DN4669_c0_g2_i1:166-987(-)
MASWVAVRVAAAASLWLAVALGAFNKEQCTTACDAARSACSSHIDFLTAASTDIKQDIHSLCDNTACLDSVKSLSTACSEYEIHLGSMSDAEKDKLKVLNAIPLADICLSTCAKHIMALPAPDQCIRTDACPWAAAERCDYFRPPIGNETSAELTKHQQRNRRIPCSRSRNIDIQDGKIKSCQEFFCDVRKHCTAGTPSLDIQPMNGSSSPIGGMIRANLLENMSQTRELLKTAFSNCTMKPLQCLACVSTMPTSVLVLAVVFICSSFAFNLP